ncbi:hypothetical protein ACFL0C_02515, partial [Patescibacteria group bacterium]
MKKNILLIIAIVTLIAVSSVGLLNAINQRNLKKGFIEPAKQVFKSTDKLSFTLKLGQNPQLSLGISNVHAQENDLEEGIYSDGDLTISPKIINTSSQDIVNIPLEIKKVAEETYQITGNIKAASLIPGKQELIVDVIRNDETTTFTQDFSWGVLAVNTNKSIYTPNETAVIAMAVLDDAGEMVCDANVTLLITDPNGRKTLLDTHDNTIRVSPNCSKKEYIPTPDYETKYTTNSTGTYSMRLTATTPNGSYSITDEFEVRDYVPFDIERITATRIFP